MSLGRNFLILLLIHITMEYILVFVVDAQLGMWLYINNHVKHPPLGTLWAIKHHLLVPFFSFGFANAVNNYRVINLVEVMKWSILYIYIY